jgi:hypothetical protein
VARFQLLSLTFITALVWAALPFVVHQPDPGCTAIKLRLHSCNVSSQIHNGVLSLLGNQTSPGTKGNTPTGKGKGKTKKPPAPNCAIFGSLCSQFGMIEPGQPGNPSVTISQLVNFKPTPGTDHMQPNGWLVVGLPTNFYSVVGVEVENGTLLGQPASVRFTPISWHWVYGDGASATRPTAGRTWAAQRIAEFDPTPTSHVYSKTGTYFIDLSITFRAEYKWADGVWTPVIGTITLPANRLEASAGSAKTVLVNRDCTENPHGPGC